MTDFEQLKAMVAEWEKEKSLPLAYDICELISKHFNDDTQDENNTNE